MSSDIVRDFRDLDQATLQRVVEVELQRVETLARGSKLTREELGTLDNFWNPFLHRRRDWVPLIAILDRESQKLTNREDCPLALALVRARLAALMKVGFLGNEILEWPSGKISGTAKLWLTNDGAAYFSSAFPAALRNPLLFAKRHLSLLQLVAVAVTISLTMGALIARMFGWTG